MNIIDSKYHKDSIVFENISIVPDVRFFTLFAFFNGILGYRDEKYSYMTDERIELINDIEKAAAEIDQNLICKWKEFYLRHKAHIWLYICYISYCELPPLFTKGENFDNHYPGLCIHRLENFNEILSEFYLMLDIEHLYFSKYKQVILSYMNIYSKDLILSEKDYMFSYLRIDKNRHSDYNLFLIPIPFDSHCSGYGAPQKDRMYLFASKGAQRPGLNIHEYIHLFINEAVESVSDLDELDIAEIFRQNINKSWVQSDYSELYSYISENFVRAVDFRILENLYAKNNKEIDYKTPMFKDFNENGLALAETIYDKLPEYEINSDKFPDITHFITDFIHTFKI